ncbi:MAG: hydrolase [Verrucomicrobiaceae bacterium]|nr:hydrolase [Verrucomicrobiaceae bacterium]
MSFWYPHVTVATVVEDQGRFLLVEEYAEGKLVFNQPAGHLERDENLIQAAARETLEETGWSVEILGLIGFSLYTAPANGVTYCRHSFHGKPLQHDPARPLDEGIERAVWLSYEEILTLAPRMRSPMVIKTIEQFRSGHRYPLSLIYN